MNIISTLADGLKIIQPKVFEDSRGYFLESFSLKKFQEEVFNTTFVQDNESMSEYGVLRGLHYQLPPFSQSKLVRVISGEVLDVAVDIRQKSPTFGKHVSVILSGDNKKMMFIPRGFAHGFIVLSKKAIFSYKVDNYYAPDYEEGIMYDDKKLNINWQLNENDIKVSEKDKIYPTFKNAKIF